MELDTAQQDMLAAEATAMLTRLQRISKRQRELLAQLSSPALAPSGVQPNPDVVRIAVAARTLGCLTKAYCPLHIVQTLSHTFLISRSIPPGM